MEMTRRTRQNWALVLLTICPRLVLFGRALANHMDARGGLIIYDGYLAIAQSLLHHGVFAYDGVHSISTRAPLMPLLMMPGVAAGAPVYWLFIFQLAISVFAVLNIRSAALSFGASSRAAFTLAAFISLNPWFMLLARYGSTAVTALFLISCLLRLLAARRYALLGVCGGLLVLCHPSCALALPGALGSDAIKNGWRTVLRGAAIAMLAYFATLTPWVVRNYVATGRIVPTVDGFGYQYLLGSSTIKYGLPYPKALKPLLPPGHDTALFATVDSTANVKMDRIAKQEMLDTILHRPAQFLYRCSKQFGWFWIGDKLRKTHLAYLAHSLYILPLLIGSLAAIFMRWRMSGSLMLISAPTVLIHTVVVSLAAEGMYLMPVLPVLAVMTASVGEDLFSTFRNLGRRNQRSGERVSSAAIVQF